MSMYRVLVVDDEAGMLRAVERVLSQEYKVAGTRVSRDAVALAREFKPDLAILDIQMPDIDGFELMEELQSLDPDLDVILMTGSVHEIDAKLIRAIRKKAFYFLQKPFDREVLLTLVERCLDLKRLDTENRKHLQHIQRELADARAFQQSLLPPAQGKVGRLSVSAQYIPCSELAGDFYDYVAAGPDAVLLIADVSGHGATAAMLTGIVKSAFHSASVENYEPASIVERVANGIRTFDPHRFITLICVRLGSGSLDYINAGHPPGILAGPDTCAAVLGPTGPMICPAFPNFSWEQHTIRIQRENRIVLFTDGIIDAESETGHYGLDSLLEQVKNKPPAGGLLSRQILEDVRRFAAGRPIHDDLTLVVADF